MGSQIESEGDSSGVRVSVRVECRERKERARWWRVFGLAVRTTRFENDERRITCCSVVVTRMAVHRGLGPHLNHESFRKSMLSAQRKRIDVMFSGFTSRCLFSTEYREKLIISR